MSDLSWKIFANIYIAAKPSSFDAPDWKELESQIASRLNVQKDFKLHISLIQLRNLKYTKNKKKDVVVSDMTIQGYAMFKWWIISVFVPWDYHALIWKFRPRPPNLNIWKVSFSQMN